MLKTIVMVAYVIISVALIIIVLSQEGKEASLTNSITGGGYNDSSYWSKNKGNSKEEVLKKITTVLGILFIVIALLLDSKLF